MKPKLDPIPSDYSHTNKLMGSLSRFKNGHFNTNLNQPYIYIDLIVLEVVKLLN
jgi:hypothetical protein